MDSSSHGTLVVAARSSDDPNALAERLMGALSGATRRVRREMRYHSGLELTVPQFRALRFVERHPGTDLTGVATHLGMSPSSASALVERLRRAGYVDRTTDPAERRRIRIDLSPRGKDAVDRAVTGTRSWLSGELQALTARERRDLEAALLILMRLGDVVDGTTRP
ncbi:MAG TPA: MarR family transcriptional regulator [Candidatus Limnocylindrales bacterium]|nr:MarR family transcriptional regulator [Candidatus Limnocylindrales bacterium]